MVLELFHAPVSGLTVGKIEGGQNSRVIQGHLDKAGDASQPGTKSRSQTLDSSLASPKAFSAYPVPLLSVSVSQGII